MVHHIAVKCKDTVSIELWKLVTNVNGLHSTSIIKKMSEQNMKIKNVAYKTVNDQDIYKDIYTKNSFSLLMYILRLSYVDIL